MPPAPLTAFADPAVPWALAGVAGGAGPGQPVLVLGPPPFPVEQVLGACLPAWAARQPILALDFPGSGRCAPLTGPTGIVPCAVAILDLLRRRGATPRQVVAAGLAAPVALDLAQSQGSRVERVVLLDPFLPGFHTHLPVAEQQVLGRLAGLRVRLGRQRLAAALTAGALPAAAATSVLDQPQRRRSYQHALRALAPPRGADRLRAAVLQQCHVRAACLLVCGTRSPNSTAAALAMVLRRFTDARVLAVDAGRFPTLDQPRVVAAAVQRFLDGEWPVERGLPPTLA